MTGMPAAPDSTPIIWSVAVERGLRWSLLVLQSLHMLTAVTVGIAFLPAASPASIAALMLLGAAQVLQAVTLVRDRWPRLTPPLVTLGTGLAVIVLTSLMPVSPSLADIWWPTALVISAVSFAVIRDPRRGWLWALGLLGVNLALRLHYWQPSPDLPTLSRSAQVAAETGQLLAFVTCAWLASRVVRRAARAADIDIEAGREMRAQFRRDQAAATQESEAARFVHDEVLYTLRLIAMDRAAVPATDAVEAAARLRTLLDNPVQRTVSRGLMAELRAVVADEPALIVTLTGPERVAVPTHVTDALVGAVRETLRDIARHAGVEQAQVEVRLSRVDLAVTVSDDGHGFDPEGIPTRAGLADSVIARLEEIGASVTVSSSSGHGTQLRISWSPLPVSTRAPVMGGGSVPRLLPAAAALVVPLLLQGPWLLIWLGAQLTQPFVAAVATLGLLAIGLAALHSGLRAPLGTPAAYGLIAVAWAATALNVALLPSRGAHPRLLFLVLGAAAIPSILSLYRPLRESAVAGIGISAVVTIHTALRLPPGSSWLPYAPVAIAPLVYVAIGVLVRRLVDHWAYTLWLIEEDWVAGQGAEVGDELFAAHVRARLDGVRPSLLAFLATVTATPSMVATTATRTRAARLEEVVRETMPLDPALASECARLRLAGCVVAIRFVPDTPPTMHADLATVLARLHLGHKPLTVTLTVLEHPNGWRLSVVVRPGASVPVPTDLPAGWEATPGDVLHVTRLVTTALGVDRRELIGAGPRQ